MRHGKAGYAFPCSLCARARDSGLEDTCDALRLVLIRYELNQQGTDERRLLQEANKYLGPVLRNGVPLDIERFKRLLPRLRLKPTGRNQVNLLNFYLVRSVIEEADKTLTAARGVDNPDLRKKADAAAKRLAHVLKKHAHLLSDALLFPAYKIAAAGEDPGAAGETLLQIVRRVRLLSNHFGRYMALGFDSTEGPSLEQIRYFLVQAGWPGDPPTEHVLRPAKNRKG